MEESRQPKDGDRSPARDADTAVDDVVPMKLVLQPSGMAVELTKPATVVGRHTSADLRLPLPDVSRQHCRFVFADHCWQVYDLNSLNGVFVNHQRVKHAQLHHGDLVRLGSFTFQVDIQSGNATVQLPTSDSSARVLRSIADVLESKADHADEPKRQAS